MMHTNTLSHCLSFVPPISQLESRRKIDRSVDQFSCSLISPSNVRRNIYVWCVVVCVCIWGRAQPLILSRPQKKKKKDPLLPFSLGTVCVHTNLTWNDWQVTHWLDSFGDVILHYQSNMDPYGVIKLLQTTSNAALYWSWCSSMWLSL